MSPGRLLTIQNRHMGRPKPTTYFCDPYTLQGYRFLESFHVEASTMSLAYNRETLQYGFYFLDDSYTHLIFRELCNTHPTQLPDKNILT